MKVNVTNIYGMAPTSVAQRAQNEFFESVKSLGAHELSIYNYPVKSDTQDMLRSRIDGINSSVQFNDIVIFQLPTWIGLEFERAYLNQLRIYNVKVVLFIQDVVPLMFKQNYDDWMKPYIEFYNQADLIILPNLKMEERLRKEGLTVKKVIYQEIWDRLMDYQPKVSKFKRELIFIGNQERFPFTKNWQYKTQLRLYARVKLADQTQKNIIYKGFLADDELIRQLDSGFGLCWSVNTPTQAEKEYSKLNASYKLSTYLAAGVPVIVNQEMPISQFIVDHGLGWAVSSLDDANSLVQNILESEYNEVAKRVNRYGEWLRKGFQSKKIYIDVIASLLDE